MLDEVTAERAEALGIAGAGELLVGAARPAPAGGLGAGPPLHAPATRASASTSWSASSARGRRPRSGRCAARTASCCSARGTTRRPPTSCCGRARATRRSHRPSRPSAASSSGWTSPSPSGWLRELEPVAGTSDRLTAAELMLAISLRGLPPRRARSPTGWRWRGERDRLARSSPLSGSMMAWCLLARRAHRRRERGHRDDAEQPRGRRRPLPRCASSTTTRAGEPEPPPQPSGGPLDALIMRVHYAHGRLPDVSHAPESSWVAAVDTPWRIGALRAMGRTEQALELYAATPPDTWSPAWTHGIVGAELMIDLGDLEQARRVMAQGRALIHETGSIVFEMLNRLIEAKLELRLAHDPVAALAILDALDREGDARPLRLHRGAAGDLARAGAAAQQPATRTPSSRSRAPSRACSGPGGSSSCRPRPRCSPRRTGGAATRTPPTAPPTSRSTPRPGRAPTTTCSWRWRTSPRSSRGASTPRRRPTRAWHAIGRALMAEGVALDASPAHPDPGRRARPAGDRGRRARGPPADREERRAARVPRRGAGAGGRARRAARRAVRRARRRLRRAPTCARPSTGCARCSPRAWARRSTAATLRFGGPVSLSGDAARAESLLRRGVAPAGRGAAGGAARRAGPARPGRVPRGRRRAVGRRAPRAPRRAARGRAARRRAPGLRGGPLHGGGRARRRPRSARTRSARARGGCGCSVAGIVGDEDGVIAAYRGCADALDTLGARPSDATRQLLESLRR